jgi:hypothetical protein
MIEKIQQKQKNDSGYRQQHVDPRLDGYNFHWLTGQVIGEHL